MEETLFLYLAIAALTCCLTRLVPSKAFTGALSHNYSHLIRFYILSLPCILLHTLFWGLRDGVGTDYDNYVRWFETAEQVLSLGIEPEIVFLYLCRILELLGFTSISLFVATSFLNILPIYIVGRQYDKNTLTLLVLFFYLSCSVFHCQNEVRHCLSISVLLPLPLLLEGKHSNAKTITIILLILTAFFIHRSSLLFSLASLFFRYYKKINVKPIFIFAIYIILEFIGPQLQVGILENSVGLIVALGYEDQLYNAFAQAGQGVTYRSGLGIPLRIALNSIVIYVYSMVSKRENEKNAICLFFIIFFIGMYLDRILSGSIVLHRVAGIFTFAKFITIGFTASYLFKSKKGMDKVFGVFLIIGYLLMFIMGVVINSNGVVPYKMIKL